MKLGILCLQFQWIVVCFPVLGRLLWFSLVRLLVLLKRLLVRRRLILREESFGIDIIARLQILQSVVGRILHASKILNPLMMFHQIVRGRATSCRAPLWKCLSNEDRKALDWESIAAGLLHDTVEDTNIVTFDRIEKDFGPTICHIVEGETKVHVIIVKLADRLHNMRTLSHMPPHKQVSIAKETLQVFAPLANLLGMYKIKEPSLSLRICHLCTQTPRIMRRSLKELQSFIRNMKGS